MLISVVGYDSNLIPCLIRSLGFCAFTCEPVCRVVLLPLSIPRRRGDFEDEHGKIPYFSCFYSDVSVRSEIFTM